jgi:hypothetical protein
VIIARGASGFFDARIRGTVIFVRAVPDCCCSTP